MSQPQDPPSGESFPSYDPTVTHSTDFVVVFAMANGQRQETLFSDRVTEEHALAMIEAVASRQSSKWVEIDDATLITQVSEREVLVYRSGVWTGDRLTRVVIARVR